MKGLRRQISSCEGSPQRTSSSLRRETSFAERIYAIVAMIPKGYALTYGEVARRAGYPGAARAVGNALNRNPDMVRVPCHRVVRAGGDPGGYVRGSKEKKALLRREGALDARGKARLWRGRRSGE
jgi:methylated-DNA-[protein]-cysteine S-methyltransferase